MEIDNNAIMAAVVTVLGTVFALYAKMGEAKKTLAKEIKQSLQAEDAAHRADAIPQPFMVREEDRPMTVAGHEAVCGALHGRVGTLEKRMVQVERKMESDKSEIIKSGEERAIKIHDRLNIAIEKIGELKGQMGELAKRV